MSIKKVTHQAEVQLILNWILVLVCVTAPLVKVVESRELDETTVPSTNGSEKCTPCGESSPPPPIVYPSPPPPPPIMYLSPPPPPPVIYSSPPPPPSPKKPPSQYCPPPPSSGYIYMTGPPGNLYPVVEDVNGASRHHGFAAFLPLLVGLLTLLFFWY